MKSQAKTDSPAVRTCEGLPPNGVSDPLGKELGDNPYVVLPEVTPAYLSEDIKKCQLARQRSHQLDERAGLAFRELRQLPSRLSWDAFSSETVELPSPDFAASLQRHLIAGERDAAIDLLRAEIVTGKAPESMHLTTVLLANELAHHTSKGLQISAERWDFYIGLMCSLLADTEWLRHFAIKRCDRLRLRTMMKGDWESQFHVKLRTRLEQIAKDAGPLVHPVLQEATAFTIDCEETAIEVSALVLASRSPETPLHLFGPRAINGLGLLEASRRWVAHEAASYPGGLPLTALRERISKRQRKGGAGGGLLIQWAYSCLGPVICHTWRNRPKSAWHYLGKHRRQYEAKGDPWFGNGEASRLRLARSLDELFAEVLLDVLRVQLSNPKESSEDCLFTVNRILQVSDSLRNARCVVEEVENALCGRLKALQSSPGHQDLERVLGIARQQRAELLVRGVGEHIALEMASTLKARAVYKWNRAKTEEDHCRAAPGAMRDMFEAVDLVPHSADLVMNLGRLVVQVQRFETSSVQRAELLRKALEVMNCLLDSNTHNWEISEVRDLRDDIHAIVDPKGALAERVRKLEDLIQGNQSADGPSSTSSTPETGDL